MDFVPASARPHAAFLFTAIALLLVQFIAEFLAVYFIVRYLPEVSSFLYVQKSFVVVVHTALTVALVWYAKSLSRRLNRV